MKKITAIILAAMMLLSLGACGASGDDSSVSLTMGTGSDTGTYYGYGGVLASYASANSDVNVSIVSSKGSQENIENIDAASIQLGFTQSDVMSYAYNGERLFTDKVGSFSTVAMLYLEQVQLVTFDPDIKSVTDLKGMKVSVGATGSGTYFNAMDVLAAYGMTEADIDPVYQGFTDSADNLKDGKIKAAFIVAGAPTTAITDLATTGDVYIVNIAGDYADKLIASNPFYVKDTIPAGTYGNAADIDTVAIGAVVIARDDVSDDAVYAFTKTIFDNTDAIAALHGKGAALDMNFASSVSAVPYHPGAAKYFAENGVTVTTK